MELKLKKMKTSDLFFSCFNRTFMELKHFHYLETMDVL